MYIYVQEQNEDRPSRITKEIGSARIDRPL